MLTRVDIENYRGFPSYRMDGLARVNLLVGKNNSGKTAILEAIHFLASGGDPAVLEEISARRGEYILTKSDKSLVDPSHFFHGHILEPDNPVSISGDSGIGPVQILVTSKVRKRADVEGKETIEHGIEEAVVIKRGASSEKGESGFRLTREGGVDLDRPRFPRWNSFDRTDGPLVRFIDADSMDVRQLATMSDEIKVRRLTDKIVTALQILDDKVHAFDFLTGMMGHSRYYSRAGAVIGRKDERALIPLGSMGDGMRRMLALASSLACTNDGTLCADEIDTGLHYSVMPDMWKLVIEQASACNVQVFATTHSWDCIEGLSLLCQDEPDFQSKVSIHKIDRTLSHSISFAGESVARMERNHIDPR